MDRFDLTTLGSTMLSLSTEAGVPLLGSENLRLDIAGAESNCAIALARLGRRVAWLSKVTDSPMGERVVSQIRSHGVDVSKVARVPGGRHELMWIEAGFGTNRTNVVYDRRGAAIESLTIGDVDLAMIEAGRWFHFTGITAALSESCRETLAEVVARAKVAGVKVSCDVNYRAKLWSPDEARVVVEQLVGGIDLLIVGRGDLMTLWGRGGAPEAELRRLQDEFGIGHVIMTRGGDGASGLFGEAIIHQPAFECDVVSPIGAGDAFAAGVLHSLLVDDLERALMRGCAMAALARESRSDYVVAGEEALEARMAARDEKRLAR